MQPNMNPINGAITAAGVVAWAEFMVLEAWGKMKVNNASRLQVRIGEYWYCRSCFGWAAINCVLYARRKSCYPICRSRRLTYSIYNDHLDGSPNRICRLSRCSLFILVLSFRLLTALRDHQWNSHLEGSISLFMCLFNAAILSSRIVGSS